MSSRAPTVVGPAAGAAVCRLARGFAVLIPRQDRLSAAAGAAGRTGRVRLFVAGAALLWAASLGLWIFLAVRHADPLTPLDLLTYHDAVASLDHGQDAIYSRKFGPWPGPFLYPPFAALLFRAALPLGVDGIRIGMAVLGQVCVLAAAWFAWGMVRGTGGTGGTGGKGRDGARAKLPFEVRLAATLATAAVVLWLEPVDKTFRFGQVSLALLAVLMYDLSRGDGHRGKGIGVGLAAGFKLTPALFVVYFLLTRRYRAAANAVLAFGTTVLVGAAFLPKAAVQFWTGAIADNTEINKNVALYDAVNQSLRATVIRLAGAESALTTLAWVLACAVCAPVLLAAAARAARRGDELLGVLLCAGVTLLVSPISWSHHWVWAVPAAVLIAYHAATRVRFRWLLGTYLALLAVYPVRLGQYGSVAPDRPMLPYGLVWLTPHQGGRDLTWNWWQTLVGNSLLLLHIVLLAGVSLSLLRRPRDAGEGRLVPSSGGAVNRPEGASAHAARPE